MANEWGDPSKATFRKNSIREAKQGEARANVHTAIRPLVEELWSQLDQLGLPLTRVGTTEAEDELGLSFYLHESKDVPDGAAEKADELGFRIGDDDRVRFVANREWAQAKADEFQLRELAEMAAPTWKPTPVKGNRPGSRELKRGDKGADVTTEQLFLGIEPTGTWDAGTQKAMMSYQRGRLLKDTGRADSAFWAAIIPKSIRWRRMGEAGTEIRIVQSALAAFGFMDPEAVSGRYGMVTNKAVYGFRVAMGLRGSTKIDLPMWESLFDLQYQAVRGVLIPA